MIWLAFILSAPFSSSVELQLLFFKAFPIKGNKHFAVIDHRLQMDGSFPQILNVAQCVSGIPHIEVSALMTVGEQQLATVTKIPVGDKDEGSSKIC
jgi:hypothetical protein